VSFRYIGSKARLVTSISRHIAEWGGRGKFIDAFCGTGAVAEAAAGAGWPIHLNDHLACATTMAAARLIAERQAKFTGLGGYNAAVNKLNKLRPQHGFMWREYSPASITHLGIERRYFREENAGRIDAVRSTIRSWRQAEVISGIEERLLIADLLSAVSRVANIAGTYGCFMSKWTLQADETLELRARVLRSRPVNTHVTTRDVFNLLVGADDLVYLDPPYTKRQYASYYHVLETITLGDRPVVKGVAGLRLWRDKASEFCYKLRALEAIEALVRSIGARRVLLSYSDEAHVPITDLRAALSNLGHVSLHVARRTAKSPWERCST